MLASRSSARSMVRSVQSDETTRTTGILLWECGTCFGFNGVTKTCDGYNAHPRVKSSYNEED